MTRQPFKLLILLLAPAFMIFLSCKDESEEIDNSVANSQSPDTNGNGIPDVYEKIYGATDMYVDGDEIVITCQGLPDHTSPYYAGTIWEDSLYEAYTGTNPDFFLGPGTIAASNYTFRLPIDPQEATIKESTPLGPMGISLNGVPFFNQYNGMGTALGAEEINTFDQWLGHPTPMNTYHYHKEPAYLTQTKGNDQLMGFLLDGFPVYGPVENGITITGSDLDAYHGHFGITEDFPGGIYHYHISAEAPYINGDGFYGTAGTVTF